MTPKLYWTAQISPHEEGVIANEVKVDPTRVVPRFTGLLAMTTFKNRSLQEVDGLLPRPSRTAY